ncbi:metalloregulator ArsR/SmtB family transcription factor [Paenibacillus sp. HB172176]|uniref:ArsR/SmtB family transcription factor n=1 Tax=Paenibacillus sp. HB172176 TaxID=2493690 RepID=UPI00143A9AD4|nr:metalloregulator ArsR/SmtB family transcription factor [Paenibacillus sp. HB172176]
MKNEDMLMVLKALSNETRLNILCWLSKPETMYGDMPNAIKEEFPGGICVGSIQEKSGLAQSVISSYLSTMQKAGLLESRRYGQWTYYRRNEEAIAAFLKHFSSSLRVKKNENDK